MKFWRKVLWGMLWRMIWRTTVSLKQLQLQWKHFENFKWQHLVFCIGMWSPLWKTLNSVWAATVARKSPELDKEKNKKDFVMHHSMNVRFTSHRFFAWDPSLISSPQNEKKKPRNANFRLYVRHSHDWRRHARWKKRHCQMRAAYVAFCHSEEDAAFFGRGNVGKSKRLTTWMDKMPHRLCVFTAETMEYCEASELS